MDKEFVWTNELVYEFVNFYDEYVKSHKITWTSVAVEDFIKSKEVKKEKGYEILSFQHKNGTIINVYPKDVSAANAFNHCMSDKQFEIHSVKRLSDNSIFTAKETVNSTWGKQIIERFFIDGGDDMIVEFATCRNPLSKISKVKEPLFITENNVKIYEGDYYFSVSKSFSHTGRSNGLGWYHPDTGEKYFSTRDLADEYILMNQPLLSLNEVYFSMDAIEFPYKPMRERIKELAKQKLK